MTEIEKTLWAESATQDYLRNVLAAHYKHLKDNPTPWNDKHKDAFAERVMPIVNADVIDGKAVYDLLNETGGFDYAVELYRTYRDYFSGNYGQPGFLDAADELGAMPELAPEIIGGILRRGHQMLIAGGSKTSKSFLSLELAVSVALGRDWLDTYSCKQGRVLYINGEIDRASCDRRLAAILETLRIDREDLRRKLSIYPARGVKLTVTQLTTQIKKSGGFDLVILDPIYVMNDVTDENNASAVRAFLGEIGELATETGAAIVCIHHHSKGQQGAKRSIDRASGSGVFGRWFDAIIDLSVLTLPEGVAVNSRTPDNTPMRLEFDLRDFRQPKPLSIWWDYPVHRPDLSGELDGVLLDGDTRANLVQFRDGVTAEQRNRKHDEDMERAINSILTDGREPTVQAVADEIGTSDRTIRTWLDKSATITRDGKMLKVEDRK